MFLGSKTGIRFDTKWHHMVPNQLLTARISIQISERVFLYFQKMDFGFLGEKKNNRWRVRSVKNSGNDFGGFPGFSRGQIIQTSQTPTRMIFPRPPKLPKPSKHVSTIGFYIFWLGGTVRCMRLFVPPGQLGKITLAAGWRDEWTRSVRVSGVTRSILTCGQ